MFVDVRHAAFDGLSRLMATVMFGILVVYLSQVDGSGTKNSSQTTSSLDVELENCGGPELEHDEPVSAIDDVLNEAVVPDKHQWELLQFYDDDEARMVTEVRFIMTAADVQYWNRLCHDGDKLRPVNIRIVEKDRLKSFANSCNPRGTKMMSQSVPAFFGQCSETGVGNVHSGGTVL